MPKPEPKTLRICPVAHRAQWVAKLSFFQSFSAREYTLFFQHTINQNHSLPKREIEWSPPLYFGKNSIILEQQAVKDRWL